MAYSESPFSSTSSSHRRGWNYDVFLSFSGEDTRRHFTDHLYQTLMQAGIHTFRGDYELSRGEEISPHLLMAIEGSRISVVVFSTNYASSRWCLDELVKIIECRHKIHQVVLPIFYDTDPSDVRNQTGSYAKAFDEHEEHFKEEMEKVNRWREALAQAANLSGWGVNNETYGYEAEFIKSVVNDVVCKLENKTLHVAKHPVGISSRVQGIISLLKGARNNVDMAQQREPLLYTGEYEWPNDLIGGIELGRDTPDTSPITEHAKPETELARDRCSPEELPHDEFQTLPRTEPVVQVLEQINVELDNLSVGAGRTQVEEEEDMLNNSGRLAQPGAGASSSGGLRHNPSETRGAPCSTNLGGRAFEENKNAILSWLKDDKVSIIGIYGMAGAGKTTLLKHICNELQRSPDIYYPVYWVTLSPDFSIHKLQNKIAKSIQLSFSNEEEELGLRAEKLSQKPMKKQRCWKEEELGRRAKELSQELMKKQRWILILDNLCNSFKLDEVGIPLSLKGCKLIMITRSDVVCGQMNSRNNVRVNPLSTEESLTLWYLQGGFLCCQGQGRKRIEMARLKSGWTSLMTNLILEIASAVFDQLSYALVGMVAFVALLLSTAERMNLLPSFLLPRKERTSLLPIFHHQSPSTLAPWNLVGTIVEYFGLVGGVWQCFYSTVEYAYARQKRDNPIKMCLLPFLFLSCVVISILIKKSYIDKRA